MHREMPPFEYGRTGMAQFEELRGEKKKQIIVQRCRILKNGAAMSSAHPPSGKFQKPIRQNSSKMYQTTLFSQNCIAPVHFLPNFATLMWHAI
jgi:hypothetical protein